MKLVKGLQIQELENDFKFEFKSLKKITSTKLPELLGLNQWNTIGQAILERARMLEYEGIDPFYTVRGALAESLAYDYLVHYYKNKHKVDVDLRTFNQKDFRGYDFYNEIDNPKIANDKFGGVPDMVLSKPAEFRSTIEVKSKNIKAYEYIVNQKSFPEEEVLQGKHLTTLNKMNKLTMVWVFFTDEQETLIKETMKKTKENEITKELLDLSIYNVKIRLKNFEFNNIEFLETMAKAHNILMEAYNTGLVSKDKFNNDEIETLREYIKENNVPKNDIILDLDEI